ncbi:MAG: class I SAM-dependent methyltransferase [Clostridiales bacterium]|jgi:23S rRNA (cytosine1962-C5)-methyltransferase|nr:class I SAM-dependent methyltransferase [Clostridiales bacterium]
MLLANTWKDYELLDMHSGEKLERWGSVTAIRPDPQVIWPSSSKGPLWRDCHLHYHRSKSGGGAWEVKKTVPQSWNIKWSNLEFAIRPTDFKHMGLFPEQAANWQRIIQWLRNGKSNKSVKVLNLFGYTGGATVAAASEGAHVTHVDAAKGMNEWAKNNASLSKIPEKNLRFITEDAYKFVLRELRRGSSYDAVIMDPPSYGRGPAGEIWKIEEKLYELVKASAELLSESPLFFLINSYTTGFSPTAAGNILALEAGKKYGGEIETGEIGIPSKTGLILPCGIFALWKRKGL